MWCQKEFDPVQPKPAKLERRENFDSADSATNTILKTFPHTSSSSLPSPLTSPTNSLSTLLNTGTSNSSLPPFVDTFTPSLRFSSELSNASSSFGSSAIFGSDRRLDSTTLCSRDLAKGSKFWEETLGLYPDSCKDSQPQQQQRSSSSRADDRQSFAGEHDAAREDDDCDEANVLRNTTTFVEPLVTPTKCGQADSNPVKKLDFFDEHDDEQYRILVHSRNNKHLSAELCLGVLHPIPEHPHNHNHRSSSSSDAPHSAPMQLRGTSAPRNSSETREYAVSRSTDSGKPHGLFDQSEQGGVLHLRDCAPRANNNNKTSTTPTKSHVCPPPPPDDDEPLPPPEFGVGNSRRNRHEKSKGRLSRHSITSALVARFKQIST